MSGKRRAGGPIRQLSLQQSSRRPLKKQVSEDSGRPQVHGRGFKWDTQSDTSLTVLANSITSPGTTVTQERKPSAKPSIVRPRPVKIAWSERRQASQDADCSVGVEVVAQRCKGQPRPITAKPTRSHLLSSQNDTILYSREQLAERLRNAWRERQETRPNLDIFLAHNNLDHGVNDEDILASSRDSASSVTCSPVPSSVKHDIDITYSIPSLQTAGQLTRPVTSFTRHHTQNQILDTNKPSNRLLSTTSSFDKLGDIFNETSLLNSELDAGITNIFVEKDLNLSGIERQVNFHLENKTIAVKHVSEIKISITPQDNNDDTDYIDCNTCEINSNRDSPTTSILDQTDINTYEQVEYCNREEISSNETTEATNALDQSLQNKSSIPASVRRVNFRNSSKAISGSLSVPSTPPATPVPGSARNKPLSARRSAHPLTRMMSAPAKSRITPKVISGQKQIDLEVSIDPSAELTSEETEYDLEEGFISRNNRERMITSAPARRKLKSARRKGGRGRDENSTDEEMTGEDKPKNKRGSARCSSDKNMDIVTMVSLLSPNESDIEDEQCDPVLQLPSDTPRVSEVKEDQINSAIAKTNSASDTGTFKTAGIFCLRKTPKTVCFQQSGNVSLSRSYTASYPSRRGGGSALLVLPPEDKSLPVPPPLSGPHPLARKKIIKAKSIGPINHDANKEDESQESANQEKQDISVEIHLPTERKLQQTVDNTRITSDTDKTEDTTRETKEEQSENVTAPEPDFKTPKEKECWDLYRRMMTKGVSVSYDTVLRGMLTPTEYRLRKAAVVSSC